MPRALDLSYQAAVFAEWFGAPQTAGFVMAALFEADTVPMTRPQIAARTGLHVDTAAAALVALRGALDPGEIITDGSRYALTESGCQDCLAALNDAAARELAA